MKIECCHGCEERHIKCHAHCETYQTQKILKILVEAEERKERKLRGEIKNQTDRRIAKVKRNKHLQRRK